ncbi:E3 ubiquitin-protein ligase TRIM71-like [Mytilus edulis]|uniref:E3 ubiquitin-protein ligase TRIM71-like n=1 Tax=Mytilus edulis TaxID=6550 RepID=UPI0039F07AE6
MSSNTSLCGICSLRQITRTSEHWCPECEEGLCEECKEHHKLLKATRRHEPIPITSYKSLPSYINDIKQSCVYHNEQYQIYCNEHALPLCLQCINDHSKCDVVSLEKVISNVKTSGQYLDLESRLDDLLQDIERIKKSREANVTDIETLRVQHVKEIKQIRVEINNHLDNLEKQILKELEEKEWQCKESIQKVLLPVKERKTTITQCQLNFKSIQEHASDLQTFIGMRDLEVKVNENEQYLQSLIDTKGFGHLELVYKVDTNVQNILNNLKSFGSIEIKNHISDIELTRAKDKQAQIQVATTRRTVNDVKLIQQKKITTIVMAVRGCCMSREGDFLFTDHALHSLCVIKLDGTLEYKMSVDSSYGFDITFVDDNNVAITSGDSPKKTGIDIINIENRSKIKFINLPGCSYGITHDHDSLFVCVGGRGIYKVNSADYTTSHVISCELPWGSYISVFNKKIYFTNGDSNSVACCDHNGARVWTFKDYSVLKEPRGIAVDNDGNVLIVGESSSNVVIISKDGTHHKEILTKGDGLLKPTAIFFDKQNKKLLVTNLEHSAFLYNVA